MGIIIIVPCELGCMGIPVASQTLFYVNTQELVADYVVSFAALAFIIIWWYRTYAKMGVTAGPMWNYFRRNWKTVIKQVLSYGFFHQKNVKNRYAGIMHLLISFGILILFIATSLIFLSHDILKPLVHQGILVGDFYLNFEVWANIGGVMLIAGILMGFYRRIRKKTRLDTKDEDYIILASLLVLALEGFFLGALKVYLIRVPYDQFRFVEWVLSYFYGFFGLNLSSGILVYRWMWIIHVLTAFAIVAYLPFSKLSHMILSLTTIGTKSIGKRGEMPTPFVLSEALESGNFDFKVGTKTVSDIRTTSKIDALACTDCGRCERACPAFLSGTDLSPRALVQNIKKNVYSDVEIVPNLLTENASWSCTTCQACVEECPVLIDPHSFVMEARKNLVMENRFDKLTSQYFNNLTNTQNPMGNSPSDRDALLEIAPPFDDTKDVLYWVGCMGTFDPRDNKTTRTILDLLNKAGVNYGILGSGEKCNGETARRMGEEGRYQELVLQNMETFTGKNVKKIITACPHCMNTFRNEYPKFGLKAEVVHHSQFLSDLVKEGKLKVKNSNESITLHDPCYLGRINGEYDNTRNIVKSTGNLVEMARSKQKSMCCGAGGGNYWYKVDGQEKISSLRIKQAIETRANKLAVACPFCMPMLQDALSGTDSAGKMEIKDIAELISENLAE